MVFEDLSFFGSQLSFLNASFSMKRPNSKPAWRLESFLASQLNLANPLSCRRHHAAVVDFPPKWCHVQTRLNEAEGAASIGYNDDDTQSPRLPFPFFLASSVHWNYVSSPSLLYLYQLIGPRSVD